MRGFCKNFVHLSFSLGCVLSSYPMFPEWSFFVFVVCQIPHQVLDVQGLFGFSKPLCEVGASVLPLSSCWIKDLGLGLSTGPLALVLCGHRVLAHLPLTACHLVSPARGRVLISWPLGPGKSAPGNTASQTRQKEADAEQISKDKVGFMFFFTFQPCVVWWESGNKCSQSGWYEPKNKQNTVYGLETGRGTL